MEQFTQLGIAGATLLVLFYIVRYFIAAMDKKDTYIQNMTEKFSETVNNHLAKENEMLTTATRLLDEHTKVLSGHTQILGEILSGMTKVERAAGKIKFGRRKSDKILTK